MDLAMRHRIATGKDDESGVISYDPEVQDGSNSSMPQLLLAGVDSSASSSEADAKYMKKKKKKKVLKKNNNKNKKPTTIEIVGLLALFVIVLGTYHVTVKVQRDRRRHAKFIYERAETILQNLNKHNSQQNDEQDDRRNMPARGGGQFPPPPGYGQQYPQGPMRGFPPPPGYNRPEMWNYYPGQQQQQQQQQPPPGYPAWPQQPQEERRPREWMPPPGYAQAQQEAEEKEEEEEKEEVEIGSPRQLEHDPVADWRRIEQTFVQRRLEKTNSSVSELLTAWRNAWDATILQNLKGGIRWVRPFMLPDLNGQRRRHNRPDQEVTNAIFVRASRFHEHMAWQDEMQQLAASAADGTLPGPVVDYTDAEKYEYPDLLEAPPAEGGYPQMSTMAELMQEWDQDEDKEGMITETLMHFDYTNPTEMAMAQRFRDAMVPFKLTNVPELVRAGELWTDDYLAVRYDFDEQNAQDDDSVQAVGHAQESPNHFFSFFIPTTWRVESDGMPPVRNTDMTFRQWVQHARYADAVRLDADRPHFYWQSGVSPEERYSPKEDWTFISRDLPSFSATESNFIMFHPKEQKGIQCRFGERGVVAATHYDTGRNFVGMITGAKRYILSPPNACGKLGIVTEKSSSLARHSALNFGHLKYLNDPELSKGMSEEEREWLERAATAPAVETVLKAGEALYIPSYWFHYIISVQKSAQCNVRSGAETEDHAEFGGFDDVHECPVAME